MRIDRVVRMIEDELQPVIDTKSNQTIQLMHEVNTLRDTLNDRIKKARNLEILRFKKAELDETLANYDPAVLAVFAAEALLTIPEPAPILDPEPGVP